MTAFQPVLLGSETCAYAMARAFHSAYGLKSLVYGRMQLSVTKFSSIMEPTFFADFTEPESFRRHMVEAGRRLTSERPDTTFLLIACGDDYSELLSLNPSPNQAPNLTEATTRAGSKPFRMTVRNSARGWRRRSATSPRSARSIRWPARNTTRLRPATNT